MWDIIDKINSPINRNVKNIKYAEWSKDNIEDADSFFSTEQITEFNEDNSKVFDDEYLKNITE